MDEEEIKDLLQSGGNAGINASVAELKQSWRTEVQAPEILPYKADIVDEILKFINDDSMLMKEIETGESHVVMDTFTISLYQMDIERVKYSLSRYLRSRLIKIESQVQYIQRYGHVKNRLSEQEKIFVDKLENMNTTMAKSFYDRLSVLDADNSKQIQKLQRVNRDIEKNDTPNLNEFVIGCAKVDIHDIEVAMARFDLLKDNIAIIEYSKIRDHVFDGRCFLL